MDKFQIIFSCNANKQLNFVNKTMLLLIFLPVLKNAELLKNITFFLFFLNLENLIFEKCD